MQKSLILAVICDGMASRFGRMAIISHHSSFGLSSLVIQENNEAKHLFGFHEGRMTEDMGRIIIASPLGSW
jgi:hypothetical protein